MRIADTDNPDTSIGEFDITAANRVHGYCLTWQGKWGHKNSSVKALAARDLPLPVMVAAIKTSPFYQWLWQEFKNFGLHMGGKFEWQKKTGKMEVTVRRRNPLNLVHFHLAVSDLSKRHRLRSPQEWAFLGARPHIVPTSQRGRGMENKHQCHVLLLPGAEYRNNQGLHQLQGLRGLPS